MSDQKYAYPTQRRALMTGLALSLILTGMGIYLPDFWLNAFLIIVSWTAAAIIAHRFVGERGKLVSYIIYFIGVIVASILSEIFSKAILETIRVASLSATDPRNAFYLLGSMVMSVCVYYDFQSEFSVASQRKTILA